MNKKVMKVSLPCPKYCMQNQKPVEPLIMHKSESQGHRVGREFVAGQSRAVTCHKWFINTKVLFCHGTFLEVVPILPNMLST